MQEHTFHKDFYFHLTKEIKMEHSQKIKELMEIPNLDLFQENVTLYFQGFKDLNP